MSTSYDWENSKKIYMNFWEKKMFLKKVANKMVAT